MAKAKIKKKPEDAPHSGKTVVRKKREYLSAEERKHRISIAAREVFSRTGLKGTRIHEIAKAAKVNEAVIFAHFTSKEDLFAYAVLEPLKEQMKGMHERARAFRDARDPAERSALSHESSRVILETMLDNYSVLAIALFSDTVEGARFYREHLYPQLVERAKVIAPLVPPELDPECVSLAIFGIAFAWAMDASFRDLDPNVPELAYQLTELLGNGLSASSQLPRNESSI